MADRQFTARIWGARGSLPVAPVEPSQFGANTPCVEVRCGERRIMLDAGTGSFGLGQQLIKDGSGDIDVLITHCHYDHIEGLPFFRPLHDKRWTARLWAGHMAGRMTTEEMLTGYMRQPYFPVGPACFACEVAYRDFSPGDVLDMGGGVRVRTASLNHPGGAVGYRVEFAGRSLAYITDTEHVPGRPDQNVLSLIRGAGVVIYDAAYTDETFEKYRGFGHSTWQEGARLCDQAGAGLLVAFHHQPENTDAALGAIEEAMRAVRSNSTVAREGMILVPER